MQDLNSFYDILHKTGLQTILLNQLRIYDKELKKLASRKYEPSPIELLFYTAYKISINQIESKLICQYVLYPEHKFKINKNTYYVDFILLHKEIDTGLIIELDGHEFHEKTKDQAKKDKQRDRNLQKLNYPIYHYTGSEIWYNTIEVIAELLEFMDKNKT